MENNTNKGSSVFSNSLIWFGAAVSIAEILTGTFFAPLGFFKGSLAIVIGHLIGSTLLFFAGYIGSLSRKSAMESAQMSFGILGGKFFALLNVIQLVGWTGIMIYDSTLSLNGIFSTQKWIWSIITGLLIILWIMAGIKNIGKLSLAAMIALFALTIVMCKVIFFSESSYFSAEALEALSFGQAIELAVAMPLSWLPLISDYTKEAEKPFAATFASSATYCVVSCWMYIIGMGAAILTNESDIAQIMLKAGLGNAALLVIILSTVTTTFLDAWSASISFRTIWAKASEKWTAVIVTVIGAVCAILFPMDNITNFLYFIGSVFAPMIAILLADYFVLKTDFSSQKIKVSRLAVWLAGFIAYRLLMNTDLITGCTIPDMIFTFVVTILVGMLKF